MKKKIFLCFFILVSFSFTTIEKNVYTDVVPPYTLSTSHPAYTTAASFGQTSDWNKGFLYAWDALHQLADIPTVMVHSKIPSKNYAGEEYNGLPYDQNLDYYVLTTSFGPEWASTADGIEDWADQLVRAGIFDAADFWYGYGFLIRWAMMNPNILYLTPGTSM